MAGLDLSGTVELPGVGEMKKAHVVGAVAVVGAGIGVAYWRRASGSAAADPAAGVEPTAAEGDYNTGGDPYAAASGGSSVDAYANPAPAVVNAYTPPDPDTMPPASNPAWTTRAVERLAELGYDAATVGAALGRFLAREPQANAAGVEIVRTALALLGPPPSGLYSIVPPAAATSAARPSPSPASTPPKPAPTSTSPQPAAARPTPARGVTVIVRRWRKTNPPWQSTVAGIARHHGRSAAAVWDHPRNAKLRARRKSPASVQPGDRVYVVPSSRK